MVFWVYMLQCAAGSSYVGHPADLERRLAPHETGEVDGYTASRRPVRTLCTQEFRSRAAALATEWQVKGWSRRKKEALLRGDWPEVKRLAQRRKPFRPSGHT